MAIDALTQWLGTDGIATLDGLLASACDIVAVIDRDLVFRYVNWTGPSLERSDVIGANAVEVSPPSHRERARAAYTTTLQTGKPQRFELQYGQGSDARLWDVRVGPIRDDGGEVIGLIAITTEIADLRRESADRDRFFELSLDMLAVANADGRFKRVNRAFSEALGYEIDALTGTSFMDYVHPDDIPATERAHANVIGGTPVAGFENRYRHADGSYRVISWRSTLDPVSGDSYAVARDVTDQRALENQLRHAQKMEAVGQLAGGVAHDFNNLMQAVLANAELALTADPAPTPLIADYLSEVGNAGRRAAGLTRQLLTFSRRQPLRPVPVDLNALTRGLMKMVTRLLPETIEIDFIPGHALASVNADPSQLEQVIVNLCLNARDAMPNGGKLTIETQNLLINGRYRETHPWATPGRYLLLSVSDTGIGMSPEVRERIFEPFFTTKGHTEGTGLGLSTVWGIVRQHGGMVLVDSEPGEGTTFKVYLAADVRLASEVSDEIERTPPTGEEAILLAEDDDAVRRVIVTILERAGYRVFAVRNGREAVKQVRDGDESIDLVILDLVMPELSGPGAWEQIEALNPNIRALFASGYADERYRERLPEDAVVLEKPFRIEELLARVRAKLDA